MASEFVIVVYRPKAGKKQELLALLSAHQRLLAKEGLATDRKSLVMRSPSDGSYLEVFEWTSAEAARMAHDNTRVMALWTAMAECADMISLSELPSSVEVFPHFQPVEL